MISKKYHRIRICLPVLAALVVLTACAAKETTSNFAALEISSPAFAQGASIPTLYTCQGNDTSPELVWAGPPDDTRSLALIMDDPDAPLGTWVHWVVYNLPPESRGLPEGASAANASQFNLPGGAVQGQTSFKRGDYGGPCPPSGMYHYVFHVYALDIRLEQTGLDKPGLLKAMEGHILAYGELTGTYQKGE
jgi:Raf kinase inhibitor-like YbhB/YbcL family protein